MFTLQNLTYLISRIFGPFTVMPLVGSYLLLFHTGLVTSQQLQLAGVLLVTYMLVPGALFGVLLFSHRVTDIDMTDRAQRNQWMNWATLSWWVGYMVSYLWVQPNDLFLGLLFYINTLMLVVTVITLWRKISLHMSGVTAIYFVINTIFGWSFWWLIIVFPLVGWSRLYLRKHTKTQLLMGTVVPAVLWGLIFLMSGMLK